MSLRCACAATTACLVWLLTWATSLPAQTPLTATDDLGRVLHLEDRPTRIVSLVPAVTEILFALGEGERVVGRSVWDDQPPEVVELPSVGDALRADAERVIALRPDLVILYAGRDNAQSVEQFRRLSLPSLAIRIDDFEDLRRNTIRLGELLGAEEAAERLWRSIQEDLEAVSAATSGLERRRVYYDIAWPPAITVGAGSYLDRLIEIAGGTNIFHDLLAPSPQVALEAIVARSPDVVLVPAGPAGASLRPGDRPGWSAVQAVREGRVSEVDATLLHRLGPRVGRAARSLADVLHPGIAIARPVGSPPSPRSGTPGP